MDLYKIKEMNRTQSIELDRSRKKRSGHKKNVIPKK